MTTPYDSLPAEVPDDEYFADWHRWMRGDADADTFEVFIKRKQERDHLKGQRR